MPMDSIMLLRDGSADLTATEAPAGIKHAKGARLTYKAVVPTSSAGTSPTLNIALLECDELAGTYVEFARFPQITLKGTYHVTAVSDKSYVKGVPTVGGTGTINFGKVTIAADVAGEYDKY